MRKPIFSFLLHLTGEADVAEELAQETFLQALLSFSRFRGEASVRTWLYGIARNVYRKWTRYEQRQRGRRLLTEAGSPPPGPLREAEMREERTVLARSLSALPETYRTVLVAREFEGLSYMEVGHLMGRTETWARVTCFRARQMLRAAYLQENGDDKG